MLHWFRFDNCYSFVDDRVDVSADKLENANALNMLVASNRAYYETESNPDAPYPIWRTFRSGCDGRKEDKGIWQVASIYGANGSGKTSFLRALSNMFFNIADISFSSSGSLRGERFLYDSEIRDSGKSIFCEICFSLPKFGSKSECNEYRYGYLLKTDKEDKKGCASQVSLEILSRLDARDSAKLEIVFLRRDNNIEEICNQNDVKILKEEFDKLGEEKKGALALNIVGWENMEKLQNSELGKIHEWCRKANGPELFYERAHDWCVEHVARLIYEGDKDGVFTKSDFLEFMQTFDICIHDIAVEKESERGRTGNTECIYDLQVTHRDCSNGEFHSCPIEDESDGTQKIAGMYPFIRRALLNGGLLLIDEIDVKLHPWIIRDLIKKFHNPTENVGNAQLIFTAHNLIAMDENHVHMDESYFIDKRVNGKSQLLRLDNEATSVDLNYEKIKSKFRELGLRNLKTSKLKEEIEKLREDIQTIMAQKKESSNSDDGKELLEATNTLMKDLNSNNPSLLALFCAKHCSPFKGYAQDYLNGVFGAVPLKLATFASQHRLERM